MKECHFANVSLDCLDKAGAPSLEYGRIHAVEDVEAFYQKKFELERMWADWKRNISYCGH